MVVLYTKPLQITSCRLNLDTMPMGNTSTSLAVKYTTSRSLITKRTSGNTIKMERKYVQLMVFKWFIVTKSCIISVNIGLPHVCLATVPLTSMAYTCSSKGSLSKP